MKEKDKLRKQIEELLNQYKCNFKKVIEPFGFCFYDSADNNYHTGFQDGYYIKGSNAVSFEVDEQYYEQYTIHICWDGEDFKRERYFDNLDDFLKALSNLQKTRLVLKFEYEDVGIEPKDVIAAWDNVPYEEKEAYISKKCRIK